MPRGDHPYTLQDRFYRGRCQSAYGRTWRSGSKCPICLEGEPKDVVAELRLSWVSAPPNASLPGYVSVRAKEHVSEPFQLPPAERTAFWEEVMGVAKVLDGLYKQIKMNYEIHGNTIPHLHVHLFPRYSDDPFVGGPIDPRRVSFRRTQDDLSRIRHAIVAALKDG